MIGQINGLNTTESKEFIDLMRKIDGVECNYYIQESLVEFKSVFTQISISFLVGVASSLVANAIYNFLKNKREKGKKISINIENINIFQSDNSQEIENKIDNLIED